MQDLVSAAAAAKTATEAAPTQEAQAAGAAELQKYKDLVKKTNEDKARLLQEKMNADKERAASEKELKDLQAANQVRYHQQPSTAVHPRRAGRALREWG